MIEWENGEITFEPISIMKEDDPIFLAKYARDQGLLNTDGWKSLNKYARRKKKLKRMINQAKLRSFSGQPKIDVFKIFFAKSSEPVFL